MREHMRFPRFLNGSTPFMVSVIVVLVVIVARGCDFQLPLTATQKAAEKADLVELQKRWDEQRATRASRAPFNLAMYFIIRLTALVLLIGACGGAISALTLYGWRRAATVSPVGGLYPLVISKLNGAWRVFDANKSPVASAELSNTLVAPGWELAQIATAAAALDVQREQAKGYSVQALAQGAQVPMSVEPAGETAPVQWPSTVPLTGLLKMQGGASVENIVWGMTLNPETGQQEVIKESLDTLCHIGVGGSSGWGKSRFVEMLLLQLLTARESLDVAVIDLKREHVIFNQGNLLYPVATTPAEAKAIFGELGQELDRRLDLMSGALSLSEYNAGRGSKPELNRLVLVGDETTALFRSGDKELIDGIQTIALLGRSAGLLMVLAGQNWKVGNSGGSETRDQLSSRAQFKANSKSQSRLLVDCPDAAELKDPGRAVVIMPGRERFIMQGAFVGRDEIERSLSGHRGPRYPMPQVVDVTPEQAPNSLTDSQRAQIVELGQQGESVTGIVKTVWGSKNGRRARQVRAILNSDGVTG